MRTVWRERSKGVNLGRMGINISTPSKSERHFRQEASYKYKGKAYKKPRKWQYITKPFFKRFKEPVVDIFKEAEEVQIIIDLGNFSKSELNFGLESKNYIISGKHEDCEFCEKIPLPYDVDIKKMKEIFRSGILELILHKKKTPRKRIKKNDK